jgi:hypothetical protein
MTTTVGSCQPGGGALIQSVGTVGADQLTVTAVLGVQLAAVLDQQAAGAGELVLLTRQDLHRQFLTGEVRTGQLEALGGVGLLLIDAGGRRLLRAPGLQFLDRVGLEVLVGLARCVRSKPLGCGACPPVD